MGGLEIFLGRKKIYCTTSAIVPKLQTLAEESQAAHVLANA